MIFDEPKPSELLHKKIDPRACSADHRCQGPLRYSAKFVRLALTPLPRKHQKSTGEPPLAALRNLVN